MSLAAEIQEIIPAVLLQPVAVIGIGSIFPKVIGQVCSPNPGWFDATKYLGDRGHKYYSRAAKMVAAGVVEACDQSQIGEEELSGNATGVAIGTNFATHAILQEIETVVRETGALSLSPLLAPLFSVNLTASIPAMRTKSTGPNITIVDRTTAGLTAIALMHRLLKDGRISQAVTGACEEDISFVNANDGRCVSPGACILLLSDATSSAKIHLTSAFLGSISHVKADEFLGFVSAALRAAHAPLIISVVSDRLDKAREISDVVRRALDDRLIRPGQGGVTIRAERAWAGTLTPFVTLEREMSKKHDVLLLGLSSTGSCVGVLLTHRKGAHET